MQETFDTIDSVEGRAPLVLGADACEGLRSAVPREPRDRRRAIWTNLGLDREPVPLSPLLRQPSCDSWDLRGILGSLLHDGPSPRPLVQLRCLREAAGKYMADGGAGLLRSALADFLFNYTMSQHYPHEFAWYALSQSADALNTALGPLVDKLNNDLDQRCRVG
jgi:hypothetical protein